MLARDAKRLLNPDTSMLMEMDFANRVMPNVIPTYMQQSRGIVGMCVDFVKKRESFNKDSVVRVAKQERVILAPK